jgi:hypothetical protein
VDFTKNPQGKEPRAVIVIHDETAILPMPD